MRFHEVVHSVYFDDLDAFQILHNARYLLLMERTIGDFWRKMGWGGPLRAHQHPDQHHLVRLNHLEYLRAVHDVGEVRVRIWVEKLGRTSLTFGFRLLPVDEDRDYARGHRVIVKVNTANWQPEPWTGAFCERLAPYRADLNTDAETSS